MVDLPISQEVAALVLHTEAVAVAEHSIAVELSLAAEAIVERLAVVAAACSIAEIATAQPATVAHLTSATTITRSVAHQAMVAIRAATLAEVSPLAVVTVAVRADDSLV